ncbi:hypothetical protein ACFL44_03105 [Gemmatimonadota bacterium]
MNCEDARDLILEADLTDLKMDTETPLSEHLRSCEQCRKSAEIILGTETTFAAAFDSLKSTRSFEEVIVTALSESAGNSRKRMRVLPVLIPLAAAAALIFLLIPLWTSDVGQRSDPVIPIITTEMPAVKAPAEQTAMILDSGDPDYQIIWLF